MILSDGQKQRNPLHDNRKLLITKGLRSILGWTSNQKVASSNLAGCIQENKPLESNRSEGFFGHWCSLVAWNQPGFSKFSVSWSVNWLFLGHVFLSGSNESWLTGDLYGGWF